ncbi:MAG: hypothetical protein QHH15_00270 [Candidatus Thermoplasmatota archaeon]|nr:hypothetical protein [Candidatus Thermoplasmatota archaeon]
MGYQPEGNVTRLPRERVASEELPYYRIIKQSATEEQVSLCDAGEEPLGVTVPSTDQYRWDDTNKAMVLRGSYIANEYPEAVIEGIAYVELGETVVAGERCIPGASGVGMAGEAELTALTAGELATTLGIFMDGGNAEDIVRVIIGGR